MPFPIELNQCIHCDELPDKSSNLQGLHLIQDPFDLRSKILPILAKTNSSPDTWKGLGTAFKIDSFGTLMSAQHVVHDLNNNTACFAMESIGLAYGRCQIPQECYTPFSYRAYLSYEKDDPMAALSGKPKEKGFFYDIAAIISQPHETKKCSASLKVQLDKKAISKGAQVMAIGYPQIEDLSDINEVYSEKLMCAVGTITEIYETGLGYKKGVAEKDRTDSERCPSFQVDANWPSGMSGGPVFNKNGQVIGIVSRSVQSPKGNYGLAVALPYCENKFFNEAFPCLDLLNCGWQKGWAIIQSSPWEFVCIFKDESEAKKYRDEHSFGSAYEIKYGSHEIGTDNFIAI